MNLKNMKEEEIELLSYADLTYLLLKEDGSMNTPTVFKKICDIFKYTDDEYATKIGDYYTSISLDKRFVLLENNMWDIRDRHSVEIALDDEDDEEILDEDLEEEIIEDAEEEIIEEATLEDDLDDGDDDMEDLSIIADDEETEE